MDLDEPLLLRGCCSILFSSVQSSVFGCVIQMSKIFIYIHISTVYADGIKAYCIDAVKFSIEFTYELIHTYIQTRPSHTQRIFRK